MYPPLITCCADCLYQADERSRELPHDYSVSDGTNKLRVTFDRTATDKFKNKDGRSIDEIRGGIIALEKYDLVSPC